MDYVFAQVNVWRMQTEDRVRHLRAHGPTGHAFTLKVHFPPPGSGESGLVRSPQEWTCPA